MGQNGTELINVHFKFSSKRKIIDPIYKIKDDAPFDSADPAARRASSALESFAMPLIACEFNE